ncbi:hypothetical protein F2Q68_00022600 [Brassica cretica]|uniref:Uncharacterized protein n=1 Tax=Brassica cretica TaxID=69181 RepID=A0A8S9FZ06_BRACR|nr:hypothetical protein F2Q68_00022600 [Brassica cretica]
MEKTKILMMMHEIGSSRSFKSAIWKSGIALRFNKENLGKLRKWKLWIDRCRALIIIKVKSSNYKRDILDCDSSQYFGFGTGLIGDFWLILEFGTARSGKKELVFGGLFGLMGWLCYLGTKMWKRLEAGVWQERVRVDKLWWRPLRLRRWGERGLTWRLMEYTDWIAAAYRRRTKKSAWIQQPCSDTEPLEKEILPKSHVTTTMPESPSSSIAKQEEEEARDDQPQPNT